MKQSIKALVFALAVLTPSLIYAETLNLTTYYPAPFGAYSQLRLVPQADTLTCDSTQEGVFYLSSVSDQIKLCNGTTWTTMSPWSQSAAYTWLTDSETVPNAAWKVGIGVTTPTAKLHLKQDGGILAEGTYGSGSALAVTGAGTRFIWVPSKAAIRAGTVAGTQWDAANVGNYSVAFGQDSQARTSHSVVAGGYGNIIQPDGGGNFGTYGFIGGGYSNVITAAANAVIAGGIYNTVPSSGPGDQFIGSGAYNTASGRGSVVVGGRKNSATGDYSFVGGGAPDVADVNGNQALADYASIVGGQENIVTGNLGAIGGGYQNNAGGLASSISGGWANSASDYGFVGGGQSNTASATHAAVIGGEGNTASANGSAVIGGGLVDGAGYDNANIASGINSVIAGGQNNQVSGDNSFIAASRGFGPGNGNSVTGTGSAVIGGAMLANVSGTSSVLLASNRSTMGANTSVMMANEMASSFTGNASVMAAGWGLNLNADYSAVISGQNHNVSSNFSAILAGQGNTVSGIGSVGLGGSGNTISGASSVITGGQSNIVESGNSLAAGSDMHLTAAATNSFAFGNGGGATVDLAEANTFYVFPGGTPGYLVIGSTANADVFNGGPYTLYVGGKLGGRFDGINEGELKVEYDAGTSAYYAVYAP